LKYTFPLFIFVIFVVARPTAFWFHCCFRIIESCHADFPVGKYVIGYFGWRTHTIANATIAPIPSHFPPYLVPEMGDLPLSLALGVLGRVG
jgi:prostaglandin reductase 1